MFSEVTLLYHRLTFKIAVILCKCKTTSFVRECLWKFFSLMYISVILIKNLPELKKHTHTYTKHAQAHHSPMNLNRQTKAHSQMCIACL